MTVEELIEELTMMPPTAVVFVRAPMVDRKDVYEFMDEPIEGVVYDLGSVSIRMEE
jgi:hypothetical protein